MSFKTLLVLVIAMHAGVQIAGCSDVDPGFTPKRVPAYESRHLTRIDEEKERYDVMDIEEWRFVMGQGSGLSGYDTLVVCHDGTSSFLYNKKPDFGQDWWIIEFVVNEQVTGELEKLLLDIDFFSLPRAYHADVHDGGQWFVKVRSNEANKIVYCNNYFPTSIRKISALIHERILTEEVLSKEPINVDDYRKTWLDLTEGGETEWERPKE